MTLMNNIFNKNMHFVVELADADDDIKKKIILDDLLNDKEKEFLQSKGYDEYMKKIAIIFAEFMTLRKQGKFHDGHIPDDDLSEFL